MNSSKFRTRLTLYDLLIIFFSAITVMVASGPYEGSQTDSEDPTDWWGSIAPLFPRVLGLDSDSSFGWKLFYVFLVVIFGVTNAFTLNSFACSSFPEVRFTCYLYKYLSLIYLIFNGRDGLLFFFCSIGLLLLWNHGENIGSRLLLWLNMFLAFLMLLIGVLFKLALLPLIVVVLLLVIKERSYGTRPLNRFLVYAVIPLFLLSSIFLDSKLSSIGQLKKSFPEQQVMLYDLSAAYCWSTNVELSNFAFSSLEEFRSKEVPDRILCASLVPYGWDLLRLPWINWEFQVPLKKVEPQEVSKFSELRSSWLALIKKYPRDWLELKANYLGQVLFMSNAFYRDGTLLSLPQGILPSLSSIFIAPARIIDDLLLTTLGFAFLLCLYFLQKSIRGSLAMMLLLLVGTANHLLTFVANNGRYTFSTILFSCLLLILIQSRNCANCNQT